MKELRVIIAGSRDFNDYSKLTSSTNSILNEIISKIDDLDKIRIISGTARGADRLGERFAKNNGYELSRFPADWALFGKRAGYIRNHKMANFAIQDGSYGVLIAFWDGESKGTKHMINMSIGTGLDVHIVKYKEEDYENV